MGLMRRLAAAALAAVLLLSTALGERVTFRLSADIDPVQYPAQERKLAQGLKSLFRLLTVEGDVVASDGSFDARIDLGLTNAPEKTATRIRFFGLDSHWGIQATDLGGETLMVNQLACTITSTCLCSGCSCGCPPTRTPAHGRVSGRRLPI